MLVVGCLVLLVMGGLFRRSLWLLHWPLTESVGLPVSIAAGFLLCLTNVRGRLAAILTGSTIVFAGTGLLMTARFVAPSIQHPMVSIVVLLGPSARRCRRWPRSTASECHGTAGRFS